MSEWDFSNVVAMRLKIGEMHGTFTENMFMIVLLNWTQFPKTVASILF